MASPDRGRLRLFLGLLIAAAVVLVVVARALGVNTIALAPAYMFSPMVAGLAVCLRYDLAVSDVGLRLGRPRWLAAAIVLALPLVGLTLAVSIAIPSVTFNPSANPVPWLGLPPGPLRLAATFGLMLGLGATLNAVFAFGEEFGWRGYLLWELAPLGFWKASASIGALWGIWHAPVIVAGYNYPSFPLVGVAMMVVACMAFSPVYTYVVVRAESVLAAAFLHGVFNGSAGLVTAYAVSDSPVLAELVTSAVGVAGIIAFGLAALGIRLTGAPSLTRDFATGN